LKRDIKGDKEIRKREDKERERERKTGQEQIMFKASLTGKGCAEIKFIYQAQGKNSAMSSCVAAAASIGI
jgi:hypothetical protein